MQTSEPKLDDLQPSKTIDARGTACPGPLLEAKKAMGAVPVGQTIEIRSNDAGSRKDLPAWAAKVGHQYLGMLEADGYDRHMIRRGK